MSLSPKLIIISAPSGSGKTTLVKHLLETIPSLSFSISATSRQMREGEVHGRDYFFISRDAFSEKIATNDLLEWEEVYAGNYYGTLRSEVDHLLNSGRNVIFDVDVVGGVNIKKAFGPRALSIFISPPSIEALEERLKNRNTDSLETIKNRVNKAIHEMEYAQKFDYILVNDCLNTAKKKAVELVEDFLNSES